MEDDFILHSQYFLAAAGVLVLLLMALFLATVSGFFSGVLNFLELSLGEIPVMILTGCILFIFFFLL